VAAQVQIRLKNAPQLHAALRRLSIATGKLPAQVINRAVMSIAIRAQSRMPVTGPETIRGSLEAIKTPIVLKSGKVSKSKKTTSFSASGKATGKNAGVPLLALIIQARSNPGYTGFWKRAESPWKGKDRAAGAAAMLATMRRHLSVRLSSRGFFKACAGTVKALYGRATGKATGRLAARIGKLAGGTIATGNTNAKATFWVTATRPDTKSNRDALRKIAQPVWQEALDHEAAFVLKKAAEAEYKAAARALGFRAP